MASRQQTNAQRPIHGDAFGEADDASSFLDFAKLAWVFLIVSFFGLVVESVASFFVDGFWKNRTGLLWGPFSPIYGLGAVLLTLVLYPIRKRGWFAAFAASGLVGAAFEWCASFLFEKAFGIVAWSYEGHLLNLDGRTCLLMAIVWGILGAIWSKALYPWLASLLDHMPRKVLDASGMLIVAFFIVDALFTLEAFNCWYERLNGMPVMTPIQQFFDTHYGNDFMKQHFQTMSLWTNLAHR